MFADETQDVWHVSLSIERQAVGLLERKKRQMSET